MRKLILMALLALSQVACNTPYHPPQFPDQNSRFPGLIDLIASAPGQPLDVLLVHGICSHDERWAHDTVAELAAALSVPSPALPASSAAPSGARVQVVTLPLDTGFGQLRLHALLWSPLTHSLKAELCYDMGDKNELCQGAPAQTATRAYLNGRAKDYLVDDCIADAMIYTGVAHNAMLDAMRSAVLSTLGESDAPLLIIAESMGSKYLFDTLLSMSKEGASTRAGQVAQRSLQRLRYLVMAANQIPLLGLADQPLSDASRSASVPSDSLQQLLQLRRHASVTSQPLTLIAFSDPSDVLSYSLQPEKYAAADVAVHNILVSNAPSWFGLIERPDRAHLDYLSNPDVGHLIACGHPSSPRCH